MRALAINEIEEVSGGMVTEAAIVCIGLTLTTAWLMSAFSSPVLHAYQPIQSKKEEAVPVYGANGEFLGTEYVTRTKTEYVPI
jgi:hypothetical protein